MIASLGGLPDLPMLWRTRPKWSEGSLARIAIRLRNTLLSHHLVKIPDRAFRTFRPRMLIDASVGLHHRRGVFDPILHSPVAGIGIHSLLDGRLRGAAAQIRRRRRQRIAECPGCYPIGAPAK